MVRMEALLSRKYLSLGNTMLCVGIHVLIGP
jgi:hypothetical protein